jgi:uncharacterized membrane protein HdeD (DUF308 family)
LAQDSDGEQLINRLIFKRRFVLRISLIIAGILFIIVGLVCFALPGITFTSLAFAFGLAMLIGGASEILAYLKVKGKHPSASLIFAEGGMHIILSALVLANQLTVDAMVASSFGLWILFSGLLRLPVAFRMMGEGAKLYRLYLGLGIISVLAGIYSFLNSVGTGLMLIIVIGILFVLQGINILVTGVIITSQRK